MQAGQHGTTEPARFKAAKGLYQLRSPRPEFNRCRQMLLFAQSNGPCSQSLFLHRSLWYHAVDGLGKPQSERCDPACERIRMDFVNWPA